MCIDSSCPGFNNLDNTPIWGQSAVIEAGWIVRFHALVLGRNRTASRVLFQLDTVQQVDRATAFKG
jgi:hypothetical protein